MPERCYKAVIMLENEKWNKVVGARKGEAETETKSSQGVEKFCHVRRALQQRRTVKAPMNNSFFHPSGFLGVKVEKEGRRHQEVKRICAGSPQRKLKPREEAAPPHTARLGLNHQPNQLKLVIDPISEHKSHWLITEACQLISSSILVRFIDFGRSINPSIHQRFIHPKLIRCSVIKQINNQCDSWSIV